MASLVQLNPAADYASQSEALKINCSAASGLSEGMRSNLGPMGTTKLLVSGSGSLKLTKDGNVLLHEMQIIHPTANLIAKVSTAQNNIAGDGTTSLVVLIGELLRQAEARAAEGIHPRILSQGFEIASEICVKVLDEMKIHLPINTAHLMDVARCTLRTKLQPKIADHLAKIVTEAVEAIMQPGLAIDLHMVEIMEMQHSSVMGTTLVRGLVLDHGARHPDMKKHVTNAFILILNVSLEYEKTEFKAEMVYKTYEERTRYVQGERAFIDDRVKKIIEFKRTVCQPGGDENFVIINQKGIDPIALEMLVDEGIVALRRAKRRNMERLMLACGGVQVNCVDNLTPELLGYAGLVYEYALGEEKYTFIEKCNDPKAVTILIKGPYEHSISQLKDALYDGLRAVKNCIEDGCVIPGAGAFELKAHCALMKEKVIMKDRSKLGVQVFADALLIIVKCLAENAGYESVETVLNLIDKHLQLGVPVGIDLDTGGYMLPEKMAIYDNYCVKRNIVLASATMASNLLLVDEILRCGLSTKASAMEGVE